MTQEEFIEKVVEILEADEDDVNMELSQGEIPEWDSIGHLNLLMKLSEETGKGMDPSVVAELVRLQDIYDFFEKAE